MRRRIHACHMRRRIHACHMRRRIHACHMRRRIHACLHLLDNGAHRWKLCDVAEDIHTHTHTHTHTSKLTTNAPFFGRAKEPEARPLSDLIFSISMTGIGSPPPSGKSAADIPTPKSSTNTSHFAVKPPAGTSISNFSDERALTVTFCNNMHVI
jgi:hypothetical protein